MPPSFELKEHKSWGTVGVFSRRLSRWPHLKTLLGAEQVLVRPRASAAKTIDAIFGWGDKIYAQRAQAYAARHKLPYFCVEDGFLRSVHLGADQGSPLSMIVDDLGVYYDARHPSRLEEILQGPGEGASDPLDDPTLLERASACRRDIVQAGLTKYNNAPPNPATLSQLPDSFVLVVDQTAGDSSIKGGLASADTFQEMLRAALDEHPSLPVVVKLHPEVAAGTKRGHLVDAKRHSDRVLLLKEPVSPADLFPRVKRAYVCSSQLGFDALLAQIPVTCFGAPFYAGWGLTDDRRKIPRRSAHRSIDQLLAAALLLYPRYADPDRGLPCAAEVVIDHLSRQRRLFEDNQGTWICLGFSAWKHDFVRAFLQCPRGRVLFVKGAQEAKKLQLTEKARLLAWGERGASEAQELSQALGLPFSMMEDGLLRSVGLGSDMRAPLSLVVDKKGIYYDPRTPSDLEHLLSTRNFSDDDRSRGAALRQSIVSKRITKYNLSSKQELLVPPELAQGDRLVLLVPGQVEDDASIRWGCPDINTNVGLLRAVREAHPQAYLLFKPHPDVVAENRVGAINAAELSSLADRVVHSASIADCLDVADEVHTMTSLVGFEALLRKLPVTVYGQPFYSSWGLSHDLHPIARRDRSLELDELVAGTLIFYPRYLNYTTNAFSTPEFIIDQLSQGVTQDAPSARLQLPRPLRQLQRLYRWVKLSVNAHRS